MGQTRGEGSNDSCDSNAVDLLDDVCVLIDCCNESPFSTLLRRSDISFFKVFMTSSDKSLFLTITRL